VPTAPAQPSAGDHGKRGWAGATTGGIGALALLAWKFKFVALFLLGKAKFLLLGLTKASTFLSMFASLGLYWAAFGWQLAAGLVVSIYIHEMGHVAALARYGIRATAPLFIPGVGAVIRLRQRLTDPGQDAQVGLAGPLWGLGAAVAAFLIFLVTGKPIWGAIAKLGAVLNLFNLMPIWQLDGGRAFHALSRRQRWFAAAVLGALWFLITPSTQDGPERGTLILVTLVAAFQAAFGSPAREPDRRALAVYVLVSAALAPLLLIPVKM
jgi:Zn-dependent protease